MAPKLTKADQEVLEKFNFEVGDPPEPDTTRKSKNYEKFIAAAEFCIAHPGQFVRIGQYANPTQPYNLAKAVNNHERAEFMDWEGGSFAAIGRRVGVDDYGVWVKWDPNE